MAKKQSSRRKPRTKNLSAQVTTSGRGKFPRHPVDKALRIARAILEQGAGKPCTPKEAAAFLGVKSVGPFHVEVSSAIKYGFLERPEEGKIQPSTLAKTTRRGRTTTKH